MLINVSELSLPQLDFAAGLAQGWVVYPSDSIEHGSVFHLDKERAPFGATLPACYWKPTRNREQGVSLIESKGIATRKHSKGLWYAMLSSDLGDSEGARWHARKIVKVNNAYIKVACRSTGDAMLEAAMWCFVVGSIGNMIELPDKIDYD